MKFKIQNSKFKIKGGGFTLVELIVSTGIFLVMSGVVMANYPSFRQRIDLKRTAQEIALTVRQAQSYSLGVKRFIIDFNEYFPAYGVHFDMATPRSFVLFADIDPDWGGSEVSNFIYDVNRPEKEELYTLSRNLSIFRLCGVRPGIESCALTTLNVVYQRPSPSVFLLQESAVSNQFDTGIVCLRNAQGNKKKIAMTIRGQISVEDVPVGDLCY